MKKKRESMPHRIMFVETKTYGKKPLREAKSIGRSRYPELLWSDGAGWN